jgi:hypothetical protein
VSPRGLAGDEALIAEYAAQMTRHVHVDNAVFARMKERFETSEIVEITAAIATYNMVARFLVALEVDAGDLISASRISGVPLAGGARVDLTACPPVMGRFQIGSVRFERDCTFCGIQSRPRWTG